MDSQPASDGAISGTIHRSPSPRKASILLFSLTLALTLIIVGFVVGYDFYRFNKLPPLVVYTISGVGILIGLVTGIFGTVSSGSLLKGFQDILREAHKFPAILCGILAGIVLIGGGTAPFLLYTRFTADPYMHIGTKAFSDQLIDNRQTHRWQHSPGIRGCDFLEQQGGYQATASVEGQFHACVAENTNFSNFVYEVQMNINSGDCGGLIFDAVEAYPTHAYIFFVCQNGQDYLNRYDNGLSYDNFPNYTLRYRGNLDSPLNGPTFIAVAATANQINLYVNRDPVPVATVPENMYQGGKIGVIASDNTQETTVIYKDATVWNL